MTTPRRKRPKLDEETDAELAEVAESTWVQVGPNLAVYIRRVNGGTNTSGVSVDIYARGYEDCDSLASCYAFDSDAVDLAQEQRDEVD